MTRNQFTERHGGAWREFEVALDQLDAKKVPENPGRLPGLFRLVCGDLALAERRMYGLRLCDRLNALVVRGFGHIHRPGGGVRAVWRFVAHDLPALVRSEWRLFWLCMALFWVPFAAMRASVWEDFAWVQSVLGAGTMAQLDMMYGKGSSLIESARQVFGSDFMMFGFYVWNNIGIDFRIFGGGILFGLGTLFYLVVNGVIIGAMFGYVEYACDPGKLYRFTCGHATFELLGMILAGVAGMRLGLGLLRPGRLTRREALRVAGRPAVRILLGGALLTLVAAVIEGFWSARDHGDAVRFTFAAFWPVFFVVYFVFAGRGRSVAEEAGPGAVSAP